MLLLSHFSISEVFLVLSSLSTSAWGVGASTVSHPSSAGGGAPEWRTTTSTIFTFNTSYRPR